MFAIRVTYLMGRVYSSVFDDGDNKLEPEWPPHPSRLFSALVAAWGDGGSDEELRPALQWIEEQPAPAIHAGDCTRRDLVQAFVPVNDSAKLPEDRARKPRAFPSATLSQPDVFFIWNSEPPANVVAALRTILQRTSSLGHSASLVEAAITTDLPAGDIILRPDDAGGVRLRVPAPGRLKELTARYARFERNPSKIHRPSLGETALYGIITDTTTGTMQGLFDRMIVLRRDGGPRASLRSTCSITSALRGAIMTFVPQPPPEFLSGHAPGSTRENPVRSEQSHVALVPLPFVDYEHATGDVLGMAALLPKTLTHEEQDLCWSVLSRIKQLRMPWGEWQVSLTDAEERRRALRPESWTRPHNVWSTVTPFVFDRYPKDPYGAEAEQVVRDAFTRAGFPEPIEIDLHYNPWHTGVPRASAFPAAQARPGKPQRYHCHVWARFQQPIRGPVVTGAGRYYGYGFFRALYERREAK